MNASRSHASEHGADDDRGERLEEAEELLHEAYLEISDLTSVLDDEEVDPGLARLEHRLRRFLHEGRWG